MIALFRRILPSVLSFPPLLPPTAMGASLPRPVLVSPLSVSKSLYGCLTPRFTTLVSQRVSMGASPYACYHPSQCSTVCIVASPCACYQFSQPLSISNGYPVSLRGLLLIHVASDQETTMGVLVARGNTRETRETQWNNGPALRETR